VSALAIALACGGCGAEPDARAPYPLRCPHADSGDGADHVLARRIDAKRLEFPRGSDPRPFVRWRELMLAWQRARAAGLAEGAWSELVDELDRAVERIEGRALRATQFERNAALSERLGFSARGGVWVKDETANPAGSHKVRHLLGVALHVLAAERAGLAPRTDRLAIASCGNAALAAAVVARAIERRLEAFVPPGADARVLARLRELGVMLVTCPRRAGERGDPCFLRFREAIAQGAFPFTCQGSENALAIEGGETLYFEIVAVCAATGVELDRLFVQVGGGALASASVQALRESRALCAGVGSPKLMAVQTRAIHPLALAFERVAARAGADALAWAARHRAACMRPWDSAPKSVATGILDDETYDWLEVVRGMLESGGGPVLVSEGELTEARELARNVAGIRADATGAAGLAGLVHARRDGSVAADECVAVLFTGGER
jgi:threonine synthase